MSDRFISHMLSRNIRIEEDLIDQLFNSSEKRLARTLLLLARYGKQDKPVARRAEDLAGDARGDGRHDALAREFLPEQVQEAGLHRVQRRDAAQDQQLAAERRPARLTTPMFLLGLVVASLVIFLLAGRHWDDLNSKDMGTMSRQWLAEYNAQHP